MHINLNSASGKSDEEIRAENMEKYKKQIENGFLSRLTSLEEKPIDGNTNIKYRLKKDLPFAKAGAEVTIGVASSIGLYQYDNGKVNVAENQIEHLVNEGWIEEIKPREFELHFDETGTITYIVENNLIICNNGQSNLDSVKLIKVREVLE